MQAVNTLSAALSEANFKCENLHGKRTHEERAAALHAFKAGKVQVLVATDVAARGLHIPRLPYIVNYDFPSNLETYVHRVGRTGPFLPFHDSSFQPRFRRDIRTIRSMGQILL